MAHLVSMQGNSFYLLYLALRLCRHHIVEFRLSRIDIQYIHYYT